ncbi:MAG: TolC family protein [Vicinamibacterales bacterium]
MRAAARVLAMLLVVAGATVAAPAAVQAQGSPSSSSRSRATTSTSSTAPSTSTFLGGVPSGGATDLSMTVSIVDAIMRALDHNLGVLAAEEALGHARGSRWLALAELLPDVSGRVSETREKINLAAFGFGGAGGPSFPGVPTIVGPFNVFDARVFVSQSVFDLSALNDSRAESHLVEAARLTHRSARDFVIHVAGNAYIQALAASARADAARAQFDTADVLYRQAVDLKQGGIVAGIDVLRAQVQRGTLQQRATVAVNEFEKIKLGLARLMGLPIGQAFTLDPNLPELPQPDLTLEQAVALANRARPDYQASLERVKAAEAVRASVVGGNLPSARVSADVGEIGLSAGDARGTYTLVGSVSVPIFNGNRTHGRLAQADADLRDRRSEAEDLRASIYYEIRTAYLDLQATAEQLQVATTSRDLAAQQLAQARDRFAAGVASNIEVVQAQEAVAVASEQFISAQYGYTLAKGALVRGVGSSQDALRQIIGGTR